MFDIIETIYKPTGNVLTDADGFEYPEMVAVAGYHVNTLPEYMTAELQPFVVNPVTPSRKFAGRNDTVFLTFTDKAEFIAVTGYDQTAGLA